MTQLSESEMALTFARVDSRSASFQPGSQWMASNSTCGICRRWARASAIVLFPLPVVPTTQMRRYGKASITLLYFDREARIIMHPWNRDDPPDPTKRRNVAMFDLPDDEILPLSKEHV